MNTQEELKNLEAIASGIVQTNETKKQGADFFAILEQKFRADYLKLVPNGVDKEQLLSGLMATLRNMDKSLLIHENSRGAVLQAFSGGLNPLFNEISLVPRADKSGKWFLTAVISYRGMISLVMRSGVVKGVASQTVHEGDIFKLSFTPPRVIHKLGDPTIERDENTFIGVWAMANLSTGETIIEYSPKKEIDALRGLSKEKGFSPWQVSYTAMARAKVLKKMLNRYPIFNLSSFEEETTDEL